jgi:hypothetical protein
VYASDVRLRQLLLLLMEAADLCGQFPKILGPYTDRLAHFERKVFAAIDTGDRLLKNEEEDARRLLKRVFDESLSCLNRMGG